jgi:hypothetical protein
MALLEVARGGDEPTQADAERVHAAIARRLAAGAATGLAVATGLKGSAASSGLGGAAGAAPLGIPIGLATKALLAAALVGAIGVSTALLARAPRSRMPAEAVATVPASLQAPADARPIDDGRRLKEPVPEAPASRTSGAPGEGVQPLVRMPSTSVAAVNAPSPHGSLPARDVAAEVRLLTGAHAALQSGNADRALLLLEEHARRYPKGALGEERDATRIAALCALGRTVEAHDAADRFLRAAPRSPHAGPVRASCGGSSPTPSPPF